MTADRIDHVTKEIADKILKAVELVSGIPIPQILGDSRRQQVINARYIVAMTLKQETRIPLTQIGYILGGRDHSTIINAIEKGILYKAHNLEFRTLYDRVVTELKFNNFHFLAENRSFTVKEFRKLWYAYVNKTGGMSRFDEFEAYIQNLIDSDQIDEAIKEFK